jgi:hypothetical protein
MVSLRITRRPLSIFAVAAAAALVAACASGSGGPSPKPMACMAGKDMQCGMMAEMGDMKGRMAKMHDMMSACATTDAACPHEQMMADMQAMQDHMTEMMNGMKRGVFGVVPPPKAPTLPKEDYRQHRHTRPPVKK